MFFHVNPSSTTPLYAQLVEQIKHAVAGGELEVDEKLPSVRELSTSLRINPNTVAKAYRELEQAGVVRAERGRGVFVSEISETYSREERRRRVSEKLNAAIAEAMNLGMDGRELLMIFQERLEHFPISSGKKSKKKNRGKGKQ